MKVEKERRSQMGKYTDEKRNGDTDGKKGSRRPSVIMLMFILDLTLICAAGKCMYHFLNLPEQTVKASEKEQNIVMDSQNEQQNVGSEEKIQKERTQLKQQAKEIYSRNRDILLLVNKSNAMPEGFKTDLVSLNDGKNRVSSEIYEALTKMLEDGKRQGYSFCIVSSYRDAGYQQSLIEDDVKRYTGEGLSFSDALDKTLEQVMPAGHSEHETGLAVDITAADYVVLEKDQEDTPDNQWMRRNCREYGFILRYPKDKEWITQISYEPWHFRYVGKEAAEFLYVHNLSLEEFYELLEI